MVPRTPRPPSTAMVDDAPAPAPALAGRYDVLDMDGGAPSPPDSPAADEMKTSVPPSPVVDVTTARTTAVDGDGSPSPPSSRIAITTRNNSRLFFSTVTQTTSWVRYHPRTLLPSNRCFKAYKVQRRRNACKILLQYTSLRNSSLCPLLLLQPNYTQLGQLLFSLDSSTDFSQFLYMIQLFFQSNLGKLNCGGVLQLLVGT